VRSFAWHSNACYRLSCAPLLYARNHELSSKCFLPDETILQPNVGNVCCSCIAINQPMSFTTRTSWWHAGLAISEEAFPGVEGTVKGVKVWCTAGCERSFLPGAAPPRFAFLPYAFPSMAPLDRFVGVRCSASHTLSSGRFTNTTLLAHHP
jgi:hypothetical protein